MNKEDATECTPRWRLELSQPGARAGNGANSDLQQRLSY